MTVVTSKGFSASQAMAALHSMGCKSVKGTYQNSEALTKTQRAIAASQDVQVAFLWWHACRR